jgi:putative inorganic carbon (HCO3(-)) transporter
VGSCEICFLAKAYNCHYDLNGEAMRQAAKVIMQWEWLWLLFLLPILLFPLGLGSLFLLLVPILWLTRWISVGRFFPPTAYDVAIAVLLLMVLVSLYATFDIGISLAKVSGVLLGIALFYGAIAYTRQHRNGLWHLLVVFLGAGVVIALAGLIGVRWLTPFAFLNNVRAALPVAPAAVPGTIDGMINPNEVAGALDWTLPVFVAITFALGRSLRRPLGRSLRRPLGQWPWWKHMLLFLLLVGTTLFTLAILLATLSRSAILGLFFSLLVMVAIPYRWGRWLLLAAMLAGLGFAFYFGPEVIFPDNSQNSGQFDLQIRLEIWSRALYALADFPLTGLGMNGFRYVVHDLYPLFLIPADVDLAHAHNHWLQAGLDLGIVGLVAYLALWLISMALLWQSWQWAGGPYQQALIVGLSGAVAAGWVFGLFDAIALGARPGFLWWLLLALIASVHDDARWQVAGGR